MRDKIVKVLQTLAATMIGATLLIATGTGIISVGVAMRPTTVPVSNIERPDVAAAPSVEHLAVLTCEDAGGPVGPCVMWDEARNDKPGATSTGWFVEPLAKTYPDGAFLLPECADGTGRGAPCVWPGAYGSMVPTPSVDGQIWVFGGVV